MQKSLMPFNTASGMRSHVTAKKKAGLKLEYKFQYRKRYEITCDLQMSEDYRFHPDRRFNTASGMRSHVTAWPSSARKNGLKVSIPQAV